MTEEELLRGLDRIEASYVHKQGIEYLKIPIDQLDRFMELTKDAKKGSISVEQIEGGSTFPVGTKHYGYTRTFKEGLSLYMETPSSWFRTSVVQSIDWENKTFKTLNSVYKFEFDEDTEGDNS